MHKISIYFVILACIFNSCKDTDIIDSFYRDCNSIDILSIDSTVKIIESQLYYSIENLLPHKLYPKTVSNNNELILTSTNDWTIGFFPGNLWLVYGITKNSDWKDYAIQWTNPLKDKQFYKGSHDIGFIMMPSFGKALEFTKNLEYQTIIINSAKSLSTRYNDKLGMIKSWDNDRFTFPVIIDNLMNLEILYAATKLTNDSSYYKIAENHALNTLKHHQKDDYSFFQLVDFNLKDRKVIQKTNIQGYDNKSSWARGQGWALYGFTIAYRETNNLIFLNAVDRLIKYIDKKSYDIIPFWDYESSKIPNEFKDSSAAAILSSAYFELYMLTGKNEYYKKGESILECLLSHEYLAIPGQNHYFLLRHGVGNFPAGIEIDKPLIYGDYYFLEAISKYIELNS